MRLLIKTDYSQIFACALLVRLGGDIAFPLMSGDDPGSWPRSSLPSGLAGPWSAGDVFVVRGGALRRRNRWIACARAGFLVLEGESALAPNRSASAPPQKHVMVRSIVDAALRSCPSCGRKRSTSGVRNAEGSAGICRGALAAAPVMAGLRRGSGAVLWMAASPGSTDTSDFPICCRRWAIWASSRRSLARGCGRFSIRPTARGSISIISRRAGARPASRALHVAAWHYCERDPQGDEYLRNLIEACHRHGILVYAWLELPHVSEKFWDDHPEWREKTALLQDAQLDWRKLMNLTNPRPRSRAVARRRARTDRRASIGMA